MNELKLYMAVGLVSAGLILLAIGFIAGYLYVDRGCLESPLIYGIRLMDKVNEREFRCKCNAKEEPTKTFYFDANTMASGGWNFHMNDLKEKSIIVENTTDCW